MELNVWNLIGIIISVITISGICLIVKVARKYIKFLEKRMEEKKK
jgi:hypothetical protein